MYEEILNGQRKFFKSGKTLEVKFRKKQLIKLKEMITDNESQILAALRDDLNKSDMEGYLTEVGFVLNELDYMIKRLERFASPKAVKTPIAYFNSKSYIMSEPYGVVLILSPWNYPFQLTMAPLVGAIAAGNCVIIKPSEHSPHTTALIDELITEFFDERYIKVIQGEIPQTQVLLKEKFDYIFFTGGTSVGKIVMESAARHLTPVTLELGGKSPCIVEGDVDVELTAKRIAWGKFLNAGQTCVAPDYLLVHSNIKEAFLDALRMVIHDFYDGDPKESKHYARIINEKHFDRLLGLLDGGDIVLGGEVDRGELYIAPTILDNVKSDHKLMDEEIFGPLLPIITYTHIEEAVEFIMDRPKPLALYLFTEDREKKSYVLKNTSSGGVCINDTVIHMTTKWLPFGGVGDSGMGRYHGKASFDTFSNKKSVLESGFTFDTSQRYPPYNTEFEKMKKLMRFL
ncbi:MAG TPA: aldehyde dehydrogenase [Clostridiales bacterium]|nr:aldehyde dehydrogenase [Clostridiales bacterium]